MYSELDRHRGENLRDLRISGETGMGDFDLVLAEGQALDVEIALGVRRQGGSIFVGFADDKDVCLDRQPGRIGDVQAQLAKITLRGGGARDG